jgi:hypothetical protein
MAQLQDFNRIQNENQKSIRVIGLLVHDSLSRDDLIRIIQTEGLDYFVSYSKENDRLAKSLIESLGLDEDYPVPLTVIYRNGSLYRYYEGAMPFEMLQTEIKKVVTLTR